MRRLLALLAIIGCPMSLVLGHGFAAHAQTPTPATAPAQSVPSEPAACPPTATLDQLIAALDTAISGPAAKDRTCFRALFLSGARLIPIGAAGPRLLTVDDWIAAVAKYGDEAITEQQIKYQSEAYGHVAHLWSTYITSLAGKPLARGINSIQAVYDGQSWHVIEIVWQAENPSTPIPDQYLP